MYRGDVILRGNGVEDTGSALLGGGGRLIARLPKMAV